MVEHAQQALPAAPGLRLLAPEQLHVTLAFLGEVGPSQEIEAATVVRSIPPDAGGAGELSGFLFLPSTHRARVVALAVRDDDAVFRNLFEWLMRGLEQAAVMQREKRPFRPHVTIARLRKPGTLQPKSEFKAARYPVESVCLYRSELHRQGARYTILEQTCLDSKGKKA